MFNSNFTNSSSLCVAKTFLLSLFLCVVCIFPNAAQGSIKQGDVSSSNRPNMVPLPKKVIWGRGCMSFGKDISIGVTGKDLDDVLSVAKVFADDLKELGFCPRVISGKGASCANIILSMKLDSSLNEEGYRLAMDKGIVISAVMKRGLFWGTRTALQILSGGPGIEVTKLRIWDRPDFAYRGLMIDVARNSHSIDFHKRMVKKLAAYKLNIYHFHLSDDQGYILPSDAFPKLQSGWGYTKQQLQELVALASAYGVTIVPEIDLPAHSTRLCEAIPELVCKGRTMKFMTAMCAGSERTYEIVETLIQEAMQIFPGPYFHIGADEVTNYAGWDGCPDCAAKIAQENLRGRDGLYNYFVQRVSNFVVSKGRRPIVWEGFKPSSKPEIGKEVIVEMFDNRISPRDYISAGYDVINASWYPLYVVKNWVSPVSAIAKWNPLQFGKWAPPTPPQKEMIRIGPTSHLKGACICSWEQVESGEEPSLLGIGQPPLDYGPNEPRLPAMAERAWGSQASAEDLMSRVKK